MENGQPPEDASEQQSAQQSTRPDQASGQGQAGQAEDAGWQFTPQDSGADEASETSADNAEGNLPVSETDEARNPALKRQAVDVTPESSVEWTASEYIAHQKTVGWYAIVMFVDVLIAAAVYFLSHDYVSTVAIIIIGLIFVVYAGRPPRVLTYRLDRRGLTIGPKTYAYNQFRSFSVVREGAFSSVELRPLKRFMPMVSVYFSPQDEQKIVAMLAARLPEEAHHRDLLDQFIHKIRF
jgi:hypothetical protein